MPGRYSSKDILDKYGRKLESQLHTEDEQVNYSQEYEKFRGEMVPELTKYEKWAKSLGSVIKLKVAEKDRIKIQKNLDTAHLDVTASQAVSLAVFAMLTVFFITMLAILSIFLISKDFQILFLILGLIASMFVFYYAYSMPARLATVWRLQASAQMVPAILYIVVYMKHTSNLERAIEFASKHLEGPLALDFKKVFYDVEIGKFSTIKESIEFYLNNWKDHAPEFIEAFHLIESSLFEPSESRRVTILERSLQVILDGVYEKMLKYSREIRSPLTNLYMLGIILPTLGLALLPLASTLLGGVLNATHVLIMFNIIIPFFVFYMVSEVLMKRPGGYGETSTLEKNPDYQTFKSKKPWIIGSLIAIPLFIIGLIPFLFQWPTFTNALGLKSDYTFTQIGITALGETKIFDFKLVGNSLAGPFGPVAILCSLFLPLSFAILFITVYSMKTKTLIKSRDDTKELEEEFTNSLFQLGNRLGNGVPIEMAFGDIASSTQGQKSANFFMMVSQNIQQMGMSVDKAIFDPKRGAISYYPSSLIATSMRILTESARKGLNIAARALMSISQYVKNISKINHRLKDLLAEIVSDMKSNMVFLAPLLAGIVVGLSTMITLILNKLTDIQAGLSSGSSGLGNIQDIVSLFKVETMIPPYYIQLSIGIYLIEIIFILTAALVTVDSGKDILREKFELSRNLKRGMFLYLITALLAILGLAVLSSFALSGLG